MDNKFVFNTIIFLLALLTASIGKAKAQLHLTTQFIEPNISITYDTNIYKKDRYYSNSLHGTQAFDFKRIKNSEKRVTLYVKASQPAKKLISLTFIDSFMLAGISQVLLSLNDSVNITDVDKSVRHINGFSCVGYVIASSYSKEKAVTILCNHFSQNDATQIEYIGKSQYNLDEAYSYVSEFLSGFKSYSSSEIENLDSLVKSKYSITVIPSNKIKSNFNYRNITYEGIVIINPKPEETIKEVRINISYGHEIFKPESNKDGILITAYDKEKGEILRKGELILISKYGKEINIPFQIRYENKGTF